VEHEDSSLSTRSTIADTYTLQGHVVGETPEILKIHRIVQTAARTTYPVLIIGEHGTGKGVIARAIHSMGPLQRMPFVSLNCVSLDIQVLQKELSTRPESSLESGPESSGANDYCKTLFLDKISELTLDAQSKLLRAIQDREVQGSNGAPNVRPTVRILAASTRNLQDAVAEGAFRRDLYFRLNFLSLRIPPLRQRRRDIPLLVSSFLLQFSGTARHQYRMTDEALRAMLVYDWPGNVRELENCVERACCSAIGPTLTLLDLPISISGVTARTTVGFPDLRVVPLVELEKRSILETVRQARGNKLAAAKLLGIGKTTLYRRLKQYQQQEAEGVTKHGC